MPVYVKAHRRGKSVVKAYKRSERTLKKITLEYVGMKPGFRNTSRAKTLQSRLSIVDRYRGDLYKKLLRKRTIARALLNQ